MRKLKRFALACSVMLALFVPWSATAGGLETDSATVALTDLTGGEWKLRALTRAGQPVALVADTASTFSVDTTGRVGGSGGVNRYFGNMSLGEGGSVAWSGPGFGTTMMAGPEEHMNQEQAFLQALQEAQKAFLRDGRLVLQDGSGTTILEFER